MDNLTPEQIAEKARWDALTPAQKGAETKAKKAAEKARKIAAKNAVKIEDKNPEQNQTETPPENNGGLTEMEERADAEAAKSRTINGFLNPFTAGVTYKDFVNAIPNGKTVAEYCKGKLTEDEINWISEEVEHFKRNKKK